MSETKDATEDASPMNEKQLFTYDEKSRLKTLRLLKENMDVDNIIYEASFENPESILPTNAKLNVIMDFEIKREPITNGFKYIFDTKIPQDLIDMVKEGLGGNPSEEDIMKELGPFGKIQKKYSEIVMLDDKTMKEDVYEEDREITNKMDLTSSFVFDEKFKIIQNKVYSAGDVSEHIIYEYNESGRVKSVQNADEDKKLNIFDTDGNLIKEFTAFGYLLRKYDDGRLTETRQYNSDDSLTSIVVYRYKN